MKRKTLIVAAVCLLAAISYAASDRSLDLKQSVQSLNGSSQWLGQIRSTDSGCFNNLTNQGLLDGGPMYDGGTEATFAIPAGSLVMVQCNGLDVRMATGTGSTTDAGNRKSERLSGNVNSNAIYPVGEKRFLWLEGTENSIGICPLDGGIAEGCNVFRVR